MQVGLFSLPSSVELGLSMRLMAGLRVYGVHTVAVQYADGVGKGYALAVLLFVMLLLFMHL